MKRIITALAIILLSTGCNPSIEFFKDSGESTYAMQTPETIDEEFKGWELIPLPDKNGKLPRSSGKYHLLGTIQKVGKEFRDGHLFFIADMQDKRRLRVFTRNGFIYRIRSYAHISLFDDQDQDVIFSNIENLFGVPDTFIMNERTYIDDETVMVISRGGPFIISDMTEISEGDFPVHLDQLIEEKMHHEN